MLCNLILGLLELMLGWISLPEVPDAILEPIMFVFDTISGALGFVWLIVPYDLVVVILPVVVVLANWDVFYGFIMWFLRKIPFLGIK